MPLENFRQNPGYNPPGMVDVSAGSRAAAQTTGIFIGVAGDIADIAGRRAAQQAELTGKVAGAKDAVQYDAQGNLLPLSSLPDATSIYGRAYAEAAIANYGVAVTTDAELKALELQQKHRLDPVGYKAEWNAYQTATTNAVHPQAAAHILPNLVRIGGQGYAQLVDDKYRNTIGTAIAGVTAKVNEFIGQVGTQYKDTSFGQGSVDRIAANVQQTLRPMLDSLRGMNAPPEQLVAFEKTYVGEAFKWVIGNDFVKMAASTYIDKATGQSVQNFDKAEQDLGDLYKNTPALQKIFKPDEWQAAATDIKRRAGVSLLGQSVALRQDFAQQQIDFSAVQNRADGELAAAKMALSRGSIVNGTYNPALVSDFMAKLPTLRFAADDKTNEDIKSRFTMAAHAAAWEAAMDPIPNQAFAMVDKAMAAGGMPLGDGEPADLARMIVRRGFERATGQPVDPNVAAPEIWRKLYHATGGFSAFDKQRFEGVSADFAPDKLAATAVNFRAIAFDNPGAVKQIDGTKAEMLMSYAKNVVDAHMPTEAWTQIWHKEHNEPVVGGNSFDDARTTAAINAGKDIGARSQDLMAGIQQSIASTDLTHNFLRSFTMDGTPVIAEMTPMSLRQGTISAFLTSGLPANMTEFFYDLPANASAEVVLPQRLVQQYYVPAYQAGLLRGGPETAAAYANDAMAVQKDMGISGFYMTGGGEPLKPGTIGFTDYSPEIRYKTTFGNIADRLGAELQQEERLHGSLLSAGQSMPDWIHEARVGNVRLLPQEGAEGQFIGYKPYLYNPTTGGLAPIATPGGQPWQFSSGMTAEEAKIAGEDTLHAQRGAEAVASGFATPGSGAYKTVTDMAMPFTKFGATADRDLSRYAKIGEGKVVNAMDHIKMWLGIPNYTDITAPLDPSSPFAPPSRDRLGKPAAPGLNDITRTGGKP